MDWKLWKLIRFFEAFNEELSEFRKIETRSLETEFIQARGEEDSCGLPLIGWNMYKNWRYWNSWCWNCCLQGNQLSSTDIHSIGEPRVENIWSCMCYQLKMINSLVEMWNAFARKKYNHKYIGVWVYFSGKAMLGGKNCHSTARIVQWPSSTWHCH